MGLFASKLEDNLRWANDVYCQIRNLFAASGIEGFDRLPDSDEARAKYAKLFKELFAPSEDGYSAGVPYDIHSYLTEIDTGHIDTAYMNSNFDKWLKRLSAGGNEAELEAMLDELHGSFATLDQQGCRHGGRHHVRQGDQRGDQALRPA